jgi:two-component system phosphate regulon response regulator PhoB
MEPWIQRDIRVLVIEDDPDIVDMLTSYFAKAGGITTATAEDGKAGLEKAREELPDLIILDLALPQLSGLDVCKILKSNAETRSIPIIVLTAKIEVIDRIVALELGADDYVTKPFSPREIVLRIKGLLRRVRQVDQEGPAAIGEITIDPARHSVIASGRPIQLTTVEFKLLNFLMRRSGRVEPRERLLQEVWGYNHNIESRTVDTHVQRLRKKLGEAGKSIETIRGFGYRFRTD